MHFHSFKNVSSYFKDIKAQDFAKNWMNTVRVSRIGVLLAMVNFVACAGFVAVPTCKFGRDVKVHVISTFVLRFHDVDGGFLERIPTKDVRFVQANSIEISHGLISLYISYL